MSDYLLSLTATAKARYLSKLSTLGLKENDDPYAPHNRAKFVNDMSMWPKIEFGNIFMYFIERPGVYTRMQMIQWKSLNAYNYFRNMLYQGGESTSSQRYQPNSESRS